METNPESGNMPAAPEAEISQSPGVWKTMLLIFTKPSQAFAAIKMKPYVLIPLIVVLILAAVSTFALMRPSVSLQIDMIAKARNLPPQVVDQIKSQTANANPITGVAIGTAAIGLINLLTAAVAMFIGSVLLAGKARFLAVWSVTIMAALIQVFGGILRIPLVLAKDTMYVSYGLAAVLPNQDFTSILYNLLYIWDFFFIWSTIVAAVGYAIIYDFPQKKGTIVAILTAVIMTILFIALRLVGLLLAGVELTFI